MNKSKNTKKHNRLALSDYQFLIKSMDRGRQNKQNLVRNCNNSFTHLDSDSLLVSDSNNFSMLQTYRQSKQRSQNEYKQQSKQYAQQNLLNLSQKSIKQSVNGNFELQDIISKTKKFITVVEPLLDLCPDGKLLRKARLNLQQLDNFFNYYNNFRINIKNVPLKQSISYQNQGNASHRQNNQFMKIINELQSQKDKLSNLVSQHERANIKMYIKLNEGQSQQIQKYKKMLASLFESYKKLQKMTISKNNKVKDLQTMFNKLKDQLEQKNKQNTMIQKDVYNMQKELKRKDSLFIEMENQNINKIKFKGKKENNFTSINTSLTQKQSSQNVRNKQRIKQLEGILKEQNKQLQMLYYQVKQLIQSKQRRQQQSIRTKRTSDNQSRDTTSYNNIISSEDTYRMLYAQADVIQQLIMNI